MLRGAVEILGRGLSGDDDLVAGLDGNLLAVDQKAGADLGALGVEQDADGLAELCGKTAHAWEPWLKFIRATFMPALIISRMVSSLSQAGPMVHTILVRLYIQTSI